jgi:hypothetical protein
VENGRVLMCLKFVNSPPPPWADVYSDAAADAAAVRCSRWPLGATGECCCGEGAFDDVVVWVCVFVYVYTKSIEESIRSCLCVYLCV